MKNQYMWYLVTFALIVSVLNIILPVLISRKLDKQKKTISEKVTEKIYSSKNYLLITKDNEEFTSLNYNMEEKEIIRMGYFLINFFGQSEANIDEVKKILE